MRGPRSSRASFKPLTRMPSGITFREHVAAALGAASGMLAIALVVVAIEVTR